MITLFLENFNRSNRGEEEKFMEHLCSEMIKNQDFCKQLWVGDINFAYSYRLEDCYWAFNSQKEYLQEMSKSWISKRTHDEGDAQYWKNFIDRCKAVHFSFNYLRGSEDRITVKENPDRRVALISKGDYMIDVLANFEVTMETQRGFTNDEMRFYASQIAGEISKKLKEHSLKVTIESGNIFSFCEYGFKPYSLMEILDDESGCKNGDVFFDMISGRYYMKTSGLGLQNAVWANGQFEPTMEVVSLNKELVSGKSFVQVTIKKDKSYYINGVENQYLPSESAEYLAGVLLIQNRCFPAVALANAFLERSSIRDVQKAEKVMEILSSLVLADNKRYLN